MFHKHKYIHIFIAILLILTIVFSSFVPASALVGVDDIGYAAIVGVILAACGVSISSSAELQSLTNDFLKSIPSEVKLVLKEMVTSLVNGNYVQTLSQVLVDYVYTYFESKNIFNGLLVLPQSNQLFFGNIDISSFTCTDYNHRFDFPPIPISEFPLKDYFLYSGSNTTGLYIVDHNGTTKVCGGSYSNFINNIAPYYPTYNHLGDSKITGFYFYKDLTDTSSKLTIELKDSNGQRVLSTSFKSIFHYSNPTQHLTLNSTTYTSVSVPINSTYLPTSDNPITSDMSISIPQGLINDGVIDDTVLQDITADSVRVTDVSSDTSWLDSLISSLSGLFDGVLEGIKAIFVPKDFTWDYFINELGSVVTPPNSIDLTSYVKSIEIPDVMVNYKGNDLVIVDNSKLRENIVTFRYFIGAFLSVLLLIYNYNMFMRLMGYGGFTPHNSSQLKSKGGN